MIRISLNSEVSQDPVKPTCLNRHAKNWWFWLILIATVRWYLYHAYQDFVIIMGTHKTTTEQELQDREISLDWEQLWGLHERIEL